MPYFHVLVPTCIFFLRAFSAREGLLVSQLTQSLYLGVPSAHADRPHWSRLPFPATWDPSSLCPLWISLTIRVHCPPLPATMAKGKSPPAKLDTPAKRTRSSASIATRISQGKMRREARELALHQQMKAKLERAAKAAMLKLAKAAGRRAAKKIAESDPTSPDPATSQQPRLPSTPPTDSSVATAHFFLNHQPFDRSKKTELTNELADSVDYWTIPFASGPNATRSAASAVRLRKHVRRRRRRRRTRRRRSSLKSN